MKTSKLLFAMKNKCELYRRIVENRSIVISIFLLKCFKDFAYFIQNDSIDC